ncbi:MAG: type II toxin-antitoxin system Phd/YefM family antitoxin [Bacillota bacterium]|nr:type II toxin-antitoxin system Phd/YefM family antitoxin [Bacillota bacterium]
MIAKNYSDVRNNFKSICDNIISNSETVIVTRKNDENIVMMSLDEYNNLIENYYIRRSEANYEWLKESKEQLRKGRVVDMAAEEQVDYKP